MNVYEIEFVWRTHSFDMEHKTKAYVSANTLDEAIDKLKEGVRRDKQAVVTVKSAKEMEGSVIIVV